MGNKQLTQQKMTFTTKRSKTRGGGENRQIVKELFLVQEEQKQQTFLARISNAGHMAFFGNTHRTMKATILELALVNMALLVPKVSPVKLSKAMHSVIFPMANIRIVHLRKYKRTHTMSNTIQVMTFVVIGLTSIDISTKTIFQAFFPIAFYFKDNFQIDRI